MSGSVNGTVTVEVYSDEMSAVVFIMPPEGNGRPVGLEDVKRALAEAGVVYGLMSDGNIRAVLEEGKNMPVDFLVYGDDTVRGADAEVEFPWKRKAPSEKGDGAAVLEAHFFDTVLKGEVVARKKPAADGQAGVTVMGKKAPGGKGKDIPLSAGPNVAVSEDGLEFTATLDGIPKAGGGVISVDPVFVVSGDVDGSTGNVVFAGAIEIRGSVRDGRTVEADGSVIVRRDVFGAKVMAGGDVLVMGSIITNGGLISAGGSVSADLIKDSVVDAGGDVVAGKGIIDSAVRANGSVICVSEKGRIAGGEIAAYGEIRAKEIGADGGAGTVLRSGFEFDTYKKLSEFEKLRETIDSEIAKIKKRIYPPRVSQEEIVNLKKFLDKLNAAGVKIRGNIETMYSSMKVNPTASVRGEVAINAGCTVYIGFNKRKIVRSLRKAHLCSDGEGGMNVSHYDAMTDTMKSFNVRPKKH